jgi:hypothetical protein
VSDHGEVFTPSWLVEDMLNLVDDETRRIDSRFLEPACGSGNFLAPVLERKLEAVQSRYRRSDFERRHHALFALMCVYGIELLADNAEECRQRLLGILKAFLKVKDDDVWARAGRTVVGLNIVRGDALTMKTSAGADLVFPEWGYVGRGKFQRRDFRFDALAKRSSVVAAAVVAGEQHEVFVPVRNFAPMTVAGLAA